MMSQGKKMYSITKSILPNVCMHYHSLVHLLARSFHAKSYYRAVSQTTQHACTPATTTTTTSTTTTTTTTIDTSISTIHSSFKLHRNPKSHLFNSNNILNPNRPGFYLKVEVVHFLEATNVLYRYRYARDHEKCTLNGGEYYCVLYIVRSFSFHHKTPKTI